MTSNILSPKHQERAITYIKSQAIVNMYPGLIVHTIPNGIAIVGDDFTIERANTDIQEMFETLRRIK